MAVETSDRLMGVKFWAMWPEGKAPMTVYSYYGHDPVLNIHFFRRRGTRCLIRMSKEFIGTKNFKPFVINTKEMKNFYSAKI